MSKDPAFLFYSSDFYMGTLGMTDEQVGRYIRLMCLQHQHDGITEHLMLATMGGELDPVILDKFKLNGDGKYHNLRLREVIEKRKAYSESRRRNRMGGANKTKDKGEDKEQEKEHMNNISSTYDNHMIDTSSTYVKHMNNISKSYVRHMENGNENVNINDNRDVNVIEDVSKNIGLTPNRPSKVTRKFKPPTIEEVREYNEERGNGIDPEAFIDYYEARGWMLNKSKMRSWKAAVRTWERRNRETGAKKERVTTNPFLEDIMENE